MTASGPRRGVAAGWRLLVDEPASGAWNMSVDEALLVHAPELGATLRLYRFAQPTASLGYAQSEPAWLGVAAAAGVEVVRRATGGATVVHAGDLAYSLTVPRAHPDVPTGARSSYDWVRERLLEALSSLGLPARAACPDPAAQLPALCFAGATGAEVELAGRKLIGSAQRRTRSGWLQHGSLRIAEDAHWYTQVLGSAAPARPLLPSQADADALTAAIVRAFELHLGRTLQPAALHARERECARQRHSRRLATPLSRPALS